MHKNYTHSMPSQSGELFDHTVTSFYNYKHDIPITIMSVRMSAVSQIIVHVQVATRYRQEGFAKLLIKLKFSPLSDKR